MSLSNCSIGQFSEISENRQVASHQLKRKGYEIGEEIGKYRITEIQKTTVTLTDESGDIMTVRIKKHDHSKSDNNLNTATPNKAKRKRVSVKPPVVSKKPSLAPSGTAKPQPRSPVRQNVLGG